MTVKVLIITHQQVGKVLLDTTQSLLGDIPIPTKVITVDLHVNPDQLCEKLQQFLATVNSQDGILILTDLYGSTPSNIAVSLQKNRRVKVISGLNLSMLIRTMNYPNLTLNELAQKALSGGKDGVINCEQAEVA